MNAGPADTHSPHLDLAELIAEAAGQAVGATAREHLARCAECRAEANRWNLVGDGVRALAAAPLDAAEPGRPRRPGRRVLASPWRRAVLVAVSAAAAVVLVGGVGLATGTVHISFGNAPSAVTLTAVGGCNGLEQASGTLEQVTGSNLVIRTTSGQLVTVTTTPSTMLAMSGALNSDITDGAAVNVAGPSSGRTIDATIVQVGPGFKGKPELPGAVTVQGTVTDASSAGFTVVTSSGTRVPVVTSGSTLVSVLNASLGQLQPGALTTALVYPAPDGTLTARGVVQLMVNGLHLAPNEHLSVKTPVHVRDCSPGSLADAVDNLVTGG